MLLWWRWTWSLRCCDECLRFFSSKYCSQDDIFREYSIPIVLALLKKFSRFLWLQRHFFSSTSWSFYRFDLPSTSTRKGITNPFPSWTCQYLLLSLFDLNCNFFISFLLYLFPYLFHSFPSLQFCTFSSLPQYFFFFAAISHNCTHTTPCLHFINHQNYIICSPIFQQRSL